MSQPIGAVNSSKPIVQAPEKVSFFDAYLFNSHCFKLLGSTAILTASVTWILPTAASLLNKTISSQLSKSLLATVIVGAAWVGMKMKKELVYEFSLLYTIWGSNAWWNEINKNIILGALPLEHQKDKIKNLGVTHVISTLEPFELRPGLVRPVQLGQWNTIAHKHIHAVDFVGMPVEQIHEAVEYMHDELEKNSSAKFYVHCKAGRGRSVTVVIAYLLKTKKFSNKEAAYAFVKGLRPQVNLNKNQMDAIQAYVDKYVKL